MFPTATQKYCYKCGKEDHVTTDCLLVSKLCFNCHEEGHEMASCPKPRGILRKKCGGCSQKGHLAPECPNRWEWICKNCAEYGHGHWECSKPYGYLKMKCRLCEEIGHVAKECVNTDKWNCANCNASGHLPNKCPKPRGFLRRICRECGQVGHLLSDCPDRKCFRCGEAGHISRACTSSIGAICHRCGSQGHSTRWVKDLPLCPECRFIVRGRRQCSLSKPATHSDWPKENAGDSDGSNEYVQMPKKSTIPSDRIRGEEPTKKRIPNAEAMEFYRQAMLASAAEDHNTVIHLLTGAILLDSKVSSFYASRGIALTRMKSYAAALGDFQQASAADGYKPTAEVLVCTARCRFHLGSGSSALLAIREALEIEPDDIDAKTLKKRLIELEGHIADYEGARSRKHWRRARMAYESCLRVYAEEDGELPVGIRCWGVELRVAESDWDGAIVAVDDLLGREANSVEVMTIRASILFIIGKLPEAFDQIVAALKLDPDNESAKDTRTKIKGALRLKEDGNQLFRQCHWEEAIEKWSSALALAEAEEQGGGGLLRAILLSNRASARLKLEQFVQGLKDVNEALKLNPTYYKAFLTRARIHLGLELYDSAIEDFQAVLLHGASKMNAGDVSVLKAELERAGQRAAAERNKEKDYYKILGLARNCTLSEIRKAYRLESLKHHPDKGGIAEKFRLVTEAYSTLSDVALRWEYDSKLSRHWYDEDEERYGGDDDSDEDSSRQYGYS